MSATTSQPLTLETGVNEFLQLHGGCADFQKACEVARQCFPEAHGLKVWLLEDPDEENHTWVMLDVLLPSSNPPDLYRGQMARFHEELAQHVPRPYHPFSFSLSMTQAQE